MTLKFKLPIETVDHYALSDQILKDLEVSSKKTDGDHKSLFDVLYNPTHPLDELVKDRITSIYTTDAEFIKQANVFIDIVTPVADAERDVITRAYDAVKEIHDEDNFHSKYQYIEIGMFKSLNNSPHFMQMLSFYNMLSPLITLLTPVVIVILPFFLIRYQGIPLSMKAYLGTIKHILRNHAIGKLAESFSSVSWDKRIYLIITVSFYILQVYQNAVSCYRFTHNMVHIHKQLFVIRDYLHSTCKRIQNTNIVVKEHSLHKFQQFAESNERCLMSVRELVAEIDCVTPLRISIPKACQVGSVMRLYYALRHDDNIRSAMDYSFQLNSYLNAMTRIASNKKLKTVTLTDECRWETKNMKYPHHIVIKTVGNSFKLNKPMLLTGPNASGKTTLLKSAFLNTLLSQQIGRGFYDKLTMRPYDGFHCYLDIPDTSGRDSLFQAEARRCLDVISSTGDDKSRFFCVFDELYSGTNPTEAVAGAFALTKFLSSKKNVHFVITTHFYDLCGLCEKNDVPIQNNQMGHSKSNTAKAGVNAGVDAGLDADVDDISFTYKVKRGVSSVRGGVRVLKQIGYPKGIVDDAVSILSH